METSLVRKHLEALVSEPFKISIEELAESIGVELINDRLTLDELVHAPKVVLQEAMLTCVSWSEFIASRKAMINSQMQKYQIDLDRRIETEKMNYINSKDAKRGSKSEAEMHVGSIKEFQADNEKLAKYESYVTYLDSLSRQLDMVHYATKEILKDHERHERMA